MRRPVRWNTLRTLRAGLWALLALDLLLLLACLAGARVHRDAMQTIGRETAPGIVAAERIKMALADMDIHSANELLSSSAVAASSRNAYQVSGLAAARALVDAAQNIGYDPDQRNAIQQIQLFLGEYDADVQRALDLHDQKNPASAEAWNEATNLMDTVLAASADALDSANSRRLQAAYKSQSAYSIATRVAVLTAGVVLLIALLSLQTFLADHTRRIFNLPLLAATFIALGFTLWSLTVLGTDERELKIARQDAFVSIHALWRARADARSAWDDESRLLLDRGKTPGDAQHFDLKTNSVMQLPPGVTVAQVADNGLNPHGPVGFSGYLADELNNITFPGEREGAVQTIVDFGEYLRIDQEIRRLETSGKHAEAMALWSGRQPGQGNYAFTQFDAALDRTIGINQRAFDAAVSTGFGALANFEVEAAGAAALIALLAVAGLMQRIAEYR